MIREGIGISLKQSGSVRLFSECEDFLQRFLIQISLRLPHGVDEHAANGSQVQRRFFSAFHHSSRQREEEAGKGYRLGPMSRPASHGAVICGGMPPKGW